MVTPAFQEVLIAGSLFAGLFVAEELGFRVGRRSRANDTHGTGAQIGVIQTAVLGLLGLLLAFSFAAAGTRFLERQDLIVQEANAIGTSYLRADLLGEPQRSELRAVLKQYTEHRVEASKNLRYGFEPTALADIERMHARMWKAARDGVAARPDLAMVVLPPINDVIDLHSTRLAASDKHIPLLVLALLIVCSLLSVALIGYGCGIDDHRRTALTLALTLLIGGSLWITIDLDQPRRGLMQLNDAALEALKFD